MTTEAIDLAFERKKRSDDNVDLTPDELLRYALEDCRNGDYPRASKCLIVIIEADENPEAKTLHHYYKSNMTRSEEIAHLEVWKRSRLREWEGE